MSDGNLETATLGGGCFWCLEAVFERVEGVVSVTPGYSGGSTLNPSYSEVCGGATGHAEVVRIVFDPKRIDFAKLLDVFFATHDPTTPNRQGHDVGSQYRSVVFFHSPEQQRVVEETIARGNATSAWGAPAVTQIVAAQPFYPAEDYHHAYFTRNPEQVYCRVVIAPKVEKLKETFGRLAGAGEES